MEKKGKKEGLLARTVRSLDLPGEMVGLPRVEMVGRHELRMENHKGILAYGSEEILVSGGPVVLRIRGTGLELKAMTAEELLVTGTLLSVELE